MKNLSTIVAYHDIKKLDKFLIKKMWDKYSDDIYYINNNECRSNKLQELLDKFGHNNGCIFDEFNAQSYFVDNIIDNNEYVCLSHYRRFFNLNNQELKLKPNIIYAHEFDNNYDMFNHIINYITNQEKGLNILLSIFSIISNIDIVEIKKILSENNFLSNEMYIVHKDIQKELVNECYKFIELCCVNYYNDKFEIIEKRFIGYLIELFVSFFLTKKKLENYKIINTEIKLIKYT